MVLLVFILIVSAASQETVLLKATYTPVDGSDPEYAQGAIERHDLPHREIERFTWLIRVPSPGDPAFWQNALTAAARNHGRFRVSPASSDEVRRVESGEIVLQK